MVLVGLLGVFLLGGLLMFLGASGPPRRRRMAATSHRSGWEKPATQPKEPQTPPTWGGARPAVSLPPLPDGESDPLPPEQMKATSHTTPLHRQELLAPGPAGGPDSSEEDTAAPTAQDCEDEPE